MSWLATAVAVAVRPGLWATAAVVVGQLAARGWWRRWPPVPRPDPAWMDFRLRTQYGEVPGGPEARDVVAYLRWRRRWRAASR